MEAGRLAATAGVKTQPHSPREAGAVPRRPRVLAAGDPGAAPAGGSSPRRVGGLQPMCAFPGSPRESHTPRLPRVPLASEAGG